MTDLALMLDTNRFSDLVRGVAEVVDRVSEAEFLILPFIVVAELRLGYCKGSRRAANERRLTDFLNEEGVTVAYADAATVTLYVELGDQLRRQGTPIPQHDMWIAALALQHDLALYSRDAHFEHLPRLRRA